MARHRYESSGRASPGLNASLSGECRHCGEYIMHSNHAPSWALEGHKVKLGDRVSVPGRYRGLIVRSVYQRPSGDYVIRAEFPSGAGYWEAEAESFASEPTESEGA